ncbi:hypothetical protein Deima_2820 [Deinococcus maricopensis DSM 21211]|uniref:eCIS core domain-containing protein n=1 Tax=Deinococcus maricopensis (strain DSM 21211 / LMG 22137 / NRRL B-23946 / LB-34) TaxID=709986 RepID=E8UBL0_DEIML|nr:hypothetical protein Deima_2820 [Deinococcus maricopensis DSM 21211]
MHDHRRKPTPTAPLTVRPVQRLHETHVPRWSAPAPAPARLTLTEARTTHPVQRQTAQPALHASALLQADTQALQRLSADVAVQRASVRASMTTLAAHGLTPQPLATLQRRTPAPDPTPPALTPIQRQALTETAQHTALAALQRHARYVPLTERAHHAAEVLQRAAQQGADADAAYTHILQRTPDAAALQHAMSLQRAQAHKHAQSLEHHARLVQHAQLQRHLDQAIQRQTEAHLRSVTQRVQARSGGGEALPASVQRHLEAGLNADLSRVRVHTDGEADTLSKSVNAVAFTSGQDIYFQNGRYDPHSPSGLELLAHEATHTVQQAQGRVAPGLDPDAGLEQEAQTMGAQLAANGSAFRQGLQRPGRGPSAGGGGIQRQADGSGAYGSQSPTMKLRLAKEGWYAAASVAAGMGMPNAARHMRHYLNNSGKPLEVDVSSMMKDCKVLRAAVLEKRDAEVLAVGPRIAFMKPGASISFTSAKFTDAYIGSGDSKDWFYAIGGYTYWLQGEVYQRGKDILKVKYRVHIHDVYNWDKGKAVTIFGKTITDESMGLMHKAGIAREYTVYGQSEPIADFMSLWKIGSQKPATSFQGPRINTLTTRGNTEERVRGVR